MADTIKSQSDLITAYQDNTTGDISAQDLRDFLVSLGGFALERGADPTNVANTGFTYTKDVGGITELFYIDSAGSVLQITTNGKMSVGQMIHIEALAQVGAGSSDIHLSDTTWAVSTSVIKTIRVVTTSTDWDLWLLQNDNGFAANDATIPRMQIVEAGNADQNISLDHPYEDEDPSSTEVHLYLIDNSGTANFDVYIMGVTA
jgi:hypothetical protein